MYMPMVTKMVCADESRIGQYYLSYRTGVYLGRVCTAYEWIGWSGQLSYMLSAGLLLQLRIQTSHTAIVSWVDKSMVKMYILTLLKLLFALAELLCLIVVKLE